MSDAMQFAIAVLVGTATGAIAVCIVVGCVIGLALAISYAARRFGKKHFGKDI